jgi:hypothetical protein
MFSVAFSCIIKSEIVRKLVVFYAVATSGLWCSKSANALFHVTAVLKQEIFQNFLSIHTQHHEVSLYIRHPWVENWEIQKILITTAMNCQMLQYTAEKKSKSKAIPVTGCGGL